MQRLKKEMLSINKTAINQGFERTKEKTVKRTFRKTKTISLKVTLEIENAYKRGDSKNLFAKVKKT